MYSRLAKAAEYSTKLFKSFQNVRVCLLTTFYIHTAWSERRTTEVEAELLPCCLRGKKTDSSDKVVKLHQLT